MKPLGTITMYYRFVDKDTQTTLESIMDSAYNYSDFVHQLVDKVCTEDSSEHLILLAALLAHNLNEHPIMKQLSAKHGENLFAKPYILRVESYYLENPKGYEDAKIAIDKVLQTDPEDWISCRMYILEAVIGDMVSPVDPYTHNALAQLEALLDKNEDLSCFRHDLMINQYLQYIDVDFSKALSLSEQTYEVAMECDDQVNAAYILKDRALALGARDTIKAIILSEEVIDLSKKLGLRWLQAEMSNVVGMHRAARGEYDTAIDLRLDSIRLREKIGSQTLSILPHNISLSYNEIGDGEAALEWANMALATARAQPKGLPYAHLDRARALITLGRLDEARDDLDNGHELALKSADELIIQTSYLTTGLLEMAEGRNLDAMQSFERSLEICERIGKPNRINSSLLRLTECELEMFDESGLGESAEFSGKWMERLEKEMGDKDAPGIRGLFLLQKAELRFKQGRRDEALEILKNVRSLAGQQGLHFLDQKVMSLQTLAELVDR